MGNRPKRQVVLFLVEGDSERNALQNRMAELYDVINDSIEVFFPEIFLPANYLDDPTAKIETGGDITQYYDVYPEKYDEKVYDFFLRDFFDLEHLLPKDIAEVIQLVDLDGAYISDSLIVPFDNPETDSKPIYEENRIVCKRPSSIISRHKRKRLNIDYLVTKRTIKIKTKTVPFSVYYFSSNLDHFINNNANLEGYYKVAAANSFSDSYIGNQIGFANFFIDDEDSAKGMTYEESWEYSTRDDSFASLHRGTNIDILLKKLLNT